MNEEKARRLADEARHLVAIKNSPSWPVVEEIIRRQIESKTTVLCSTGDIADSKLHHLRGHIHGLKYVLAVVNGGEKAFEQAVKAAQVLDDDVRNVS